MEKEEAKAYLDIAVKGSLLTVPAVLAIGEFTGTDVILGLDPLESVLLVLTLVLVRPISGRVSELDGLMLLTVGLVWVALQVVS